MLIIIKDKSNSKKGGGGAGAELARALDWFDTYVDQQVSRGELTEKAGNYQKRCMRHFDSQHDVAVLMYRSSHGQDPSRLTGFQRSEMHRAASMKASHISAVSAQRSVKHAQGAAVRYCRRHALRHPRTLSRS